MTGFLSAGWRAMIPLVWGVVAVCVLTLALFADPFGWRARRLDRAEQAAASGRAEAAMRHAERAAQRDINRQQGELQDRQEAVVAITDKAIAAAREQGDAKTDLGEDRYRRLREHDRRLCEQAGGLAGCAT